VDYIQRSLEKRPSTTIRPMNILFAAVVGIAFIVFIAVVGGAQ
jgi:hypothetical protein